MANEETRIANQGEGGKKVAMDAAEPHSEDQHMVPVWFFVGILLTIYGILITGQGLMEYSDPPLANYHASVWWGAFMTVIGAVFFFKFLPRKQ